MGFPESLAILGMLLLQVAFPVVILAGGLWLFARSRTGQGLLRRLVGPRIDPLLVQHLVDEVSALREDLVVMQERLDYAEHRLAERTSGPVPARPGPDRPGSGEPHA